MQSLQNSLESQIRSINGWIKQEELARAQQEINLQATKTKVIVEINQTYLQYQSAKERLAAANKAYQQAKMQGVQTVDTSLKLREAEAELFDARTVHSKTLILLLRLSGNFEIPSLN